MYQNGTFTMQQQTQPQGTYVETVGPSPQARAEHNSRQFASIDARPVQPEGLQSNSGKCASLHTDSPSHMASQTQLSQPRHEVFEDSLIHAPLPSQPGKGAHTKLQFSQLEVACPSQMFPSTAFGSPEIKNSVSDGLLQFAKEEDDVATTASSFSHTFHATHDIKDVNKPHQWASQRSYSAMFLLHSTMGETSHHTGNVFLTHSPSNPHKDGGDRP